MASSRTKRSTLPALINIEMAGDRPKVYSLQSLLTNKRDPRTRDAARLGDVLLPWFKQMVARPAEQLDGIVELWQGLIPTALCDRSRLVRLYRGTLTVALDSAPLRAELDALLRGGLLRTLQRQSRGIVFRVKTCIQSLPTEPSDAL